MIRSGLAIAALTLTMASAPGLARGQYILSSPTSGQGPGGDALGFTVAGKGVASAKPNRLEIDLDVVAASELSADAIVKYRDAKKRLQEAFDALKLENVSVEERGLLVNEKGAAYNPYMWDYQPNRRAKAEVQLTRKLVVACSDIREMDEEALLQLVARLLDVAQDAGGQVGGSQPEFNPYYYDPYMNRQRSGLVRFVLDDFDELEEKAYREAVADAEARAKRLARLSRVKLGEVIGVRELASPADATRGPQSGPADDASDDPKARRRLESSEFREIPVRVELLVRFGVAPEAAPAAGGGGR